MNVLVEHDAKGEVGERGRERERLVEACSKFKKSKGVGEVGERAVECKTKEEGLEVRRRGKWFIILVSKLNFEEGGGDGTDEKTIEVVAEAEVGEGRGDSKRVVKAEAKGEVSERGG